MLRIRSGRFALAGVVMSAIGSSVAVGADKRYGIYPPGANAERRGSFAWNGDTVDVNSGRAVLQFYGGSRSWARYGERRAGRALEFRAVFFARFGCRTPGVDEATKVFLPRKVVSLGRVGTFARRNLPGAIVLGPVGSDCPSGSFLEDSETDAIVRIEKRVGARWVLVARSFQIA